MDYTQKAIAELNAWQKTMSRKPGVANRVAKSLQDRVNRMLPEKLHRSLTVIIRQMVRAVLFGSVHTTASVTPFEDLQQTELIIQERIKNYRNTAAAEGGITGAGGFLMALADFPLLLTIKIKLLFDIAALYGFNVKDYKERLYILHIFQLAFSSQQHRREVFKTVKDWPEQSKSLPDDINSFDWRKFQQEYRDHIDLAKMAQLIPGIGAVVGVVVNYRLIEKLGRTAINAYRMRVLGT